MEPEEPADEEVSHAVLAVLWHQNRIGFAYCTEPADRCTISCGQSFDTASFLNLQALKLSVRPSVIVTPSSGDPALLAALGDGAGCEVKQLRKADFSEEGARQRLECLQAGGQPPTGNFLVDFGAIFGTDSALMVRAVGGLLAHLSAAAATLAVDRIVQVPVGGTMAIDVNTLEALQVFKTELHPAGLQGLGRAKEGLSLFGVVNHCRSPLGAALLRQWFLRPLADVAELNCRLDAVAFFLAPPRRDQVTTLQGYLKHMRDPRSILKRLHEAKSTLHDWQNLVRTLFGFQKIRDEARAVPADAAPPILQRIASLSETHTAEVLYLIQSVLDFPASATEGRLVVKLGVSETLDEYRRVYDGLDDLLTRVAREEMAALPADFQFRISVAYFPQIGYLIVVPIAYAEAHSGDPTIPGLIFHFMTADYIYYKNPNMDRLDSELGDIHGLIVDLEAEIVRGVAEHVLQPGTAAAIRGVAVAGELDCLIAYAVAAAQHGYVRPELTTDNSIDIRGGRHPLQELCVAKFIPNDTRVSPDAARVNVVLGANCSGKSVYLKQVGLIVFMAQVGCFVPAEAARLGVRDRLFSRIRSLAAGTEGLTSAFAADVLQVSAMLQYATPQSLLLVDEFGKGTLVQDGLALLAATLRHFLRAGPACPATFVATHFAELQDYGLVGLGDPLLRFHAMQVMVQPAQTSVTSTPHAPVNEIVYLYKVAPGPGPGLSYAAHCARAAGVPPALLDRAAEVAERWRKQRSVDPVADPRAAGAAEVHRRICRRFADFDVDTGNLAELMDFLRTMHTRL